MLRMPARLALAAGLAATLGGCLYETTVDANGGATMSIVLRGSTEKDLDSQRRRMESANVTVVSAAYQSGTPGSTTFQLKIADLTKLSTSEFFRNVGVKRSVGDNGSQVLTATIRNQRPMDLTDEQVARVGPDVRIVTTFPSAVIESNGAVSGHTVTWTWPVRDYLKQTEIVLTAAYKPDTTATTPGATTALP